MMHDPCFIARGALQEYTQFVTCQRHTLKTSVGGRFGSGIFETCFHLRISKWTLRRYLHGYFVSGDVKAKKMGRPLGYHYGGGTGKCKCP